MQVDKGGKVAKFDLRLIVREDEYAESKRLDVLFGREGDAVSTFLLGEGFVAMAEQYLGAFDCKDMGVMDAIRAYAFRLGFKS